LLRIESLSATYDIDTPDVVTGVSFDVAPAEIVCIVGESGSGKSTLVKAIHGLGKLYITGGRVFFNGVDLAKMDPKERRRLMGTGIALIPQDPAASFNPIRKYDKQFKEALAGHNMDYDEGFISDMLGRIGIRDGKAVLASRPYELSGGMNQRVAIAAAMMFEPKILLCDEITSALDVTTQAQVINLINEVRYEENMAIMFVTNPINNAIIIQ
jgi:ABC-type dipeptide/oligopeptide/nickel transport system ATPase component